MHIPTSQSSLVQSRPRAPIELLPMHGRVIVRVAASTMNSLDHKILAYGILAQEWPWVGGNEYAGTVVAVGPSVESLKLGDRITATAVNFIEGQEVSGWQQYALLQADLCAKIPEHVSFENACTLPTSFAAASIAIAIELGLKYPDGPPPPPKKTSAMIWQEAMASLGNGATFGWNLEEGTVQGGRWYPNPPSFIEAPLPTAEQLEEQRRIKERQEEAARLHAELTRAMTEQIGKHGPRAAVRNPSGNVPGFTGPRPNPMLWGAGDFSREAMDRQWGSGWENGGAYRRIEVVDERQDGKVLGLGLDIGPQADDWRSSGLVARWEGSGSGSTSASTSMGRSGSDESNTSDGIHMHTSCPNLPPVSGSVGRRGSEPSLRLPGPTALVSGSIFRSSPFSTGSLPNRPNSSASTKRPGAGGRGSSSPFRVPATLSHRGRGRGSPPYVRELSPLGVRREQELGNHAFPFSINSAATRHSIDFLSRGTDYYSFDGPQQSREVVPSFDPWSASAGGAPVTVAELGDAFFPSPLLPVANLVYVMDEPILIWGGSTGIGRAALQVLTRAGYTDLFVVAASERHPELRELVPPGTKFFDYRHPDVVVQIRAALGARELTKVLDTIAMPNTLKPISQLVGAGATLASALPVRTPMPDGVEVKPVMFGRCHDYTGKDVLSFKFGKERMWPLLGDLLRKDQWVFPPMVHLRGGLHACATDAMRMMATGENAGKRLVFNVEATRGSGIKV